MQRLKVYAIKLGCGLILSLAAWPAQAQGSLPAPVPPPTTGALPAPVHSTQPQTSLPAPVSAHSAPPTDPVPVVSAPQANVAVVPVTPGLAPSISKTEAMNHSALTVPVVMKQLLSHQLTAQQAWDKGAMNVDDLLYIFSDYLDAWGGVNWHSIGPLRPALEELLVTHGGERLKKPQALPLKVRLWLGEYYQSQKDPRAVGILESVLAECKVPVLGENALLFQTIERLAWYYRDTGELKLAAATWLRLRSYYPGVSEKEAWWLSDSLIETARLYLQMGAQEEAQQLYAKVLQQGSGWFAGLALWDQANELIKQAKYMEARKLLQQPITGDGADQIRVGLSTLLSYSFYRTADFLEAERYAQEAIAQYEAFKTIPRKGLDYQVIKARDILQWIERWGDEPIVCEPRELYITIKRKDIGVPIRQQLKVRSICLIPLTATSGSDKVKISLLDNLAAKDKEKFVEKEITVELKLESLDRSLDTVLILTSPKFPDFETRVLLHLEMP